MCWHVPSRNHLPRHLLALYYPFYLFLPKFKILYSNLLFCQEDMVDLYYHYLKSKYLFDFVDDIVTQKEQGHFLNIKYVCADNVNNVIENLRLF